VLAILALFFVLQHAGALQAPFFSDGSSSLTSSVAHPSVGLEAGEPRLHWVPPVAREFHYWTLLHLFGLNPLPSTSRASRSGCGDGLYSHSSSAVAGRAVAGIATRDRCARRVGGAVEWAPGVQDLVDAAFVCFALHAYVRRRTAWAIAASHSRSSAGDRCRLLPAIALGYSPRLERAPARDRCAAWHHSPR